MKEDAFEILLRDTLKAECGSAKEQIHGLQDRVVEQLGDRRPRLRWSDWWPQLLAPSPGARWAQAAMVFTTAALALFVGFTLSDRVVFRTAEETPVLSLQSSQADDGTYEVLFVLPALNAESVAVVGNFNHWEGTPLSDPDQDGIWTARVNLPPGRYEYAFIIDGRWWGQDPLADDYIRSFGEYSSVRYIGRGGDDA